MIKKSQKNIIFDEHFLLFSSTLTEYFFAETSDVISCRNMIFLKQEVETAFFANSKILTHYHRPIFLNGVVFCLTSCATTVSFGKKTTLLQDNFPEYCIGETLSLTTPCLCCLNQRLLPIFFDRIGNIRNSVWQHLY